nr:hypothetical protein BaRGS_013167 [Batillaria attramentaria]
MTAVTAVQEQPLLNTDTVDIEYLGTLPEGTFGKEYWKFLNKHVHDLMHTLLGMPPNMLGEVAVKWVEAIQTGLPMCVLAALFGPLRLGPKHRQKYLDTYLMWAIRCGTNAKFLLNVYFEKQWEKNLDDLRRELNVEPAPVPLIRTGKKQAVA